MSFKIGDKVIYHRRDTNYLATIFDIHISHDTEWYDLRFDTPHEFARAIPEGISDSINDGDNKQYYSVREEKLSLSVDVPVYIEYVTTISGKFCPKEFVTSVFGRTAITYLSHKDKSNYAACESCGEYHELFELRSVWGYDGNGYNRTAHYFCRDCVDTYSRTCCDCNNRFLPRNINSDGRCPTCARQARNLIRSYHNSHYRRPNFYGSTRDNMYPYMGFELETENIDEDDDRAIDCAYNVHQILGDEFVNTERDGSLNCGFETISQPATLQFHASMEDKYRTLMDNYHEYGMESTTNCGMHVHFNRNYFTSEDNLVNLFTIFNKFWDNIVEFSRRNTEQIERWARKPDDDVEEAIIENENRYIAINLTNTNTIEFRIFASTTDYDTFMKTLTFVNNIVMFSKYATKEQIDDLSWEDLFDTNSITNMALSAA